MAVGIGELAEVQRQAGPATSRLEALEMQRAQFEAEVQGLLLKADGKLKAANNSEARERQLKKSYERDIDFGDPDRETGPEEDTVRSIDAPSGEAERVRPLRMVVAADNKAIAVAAKWAT